MAIYWVTEMDREQGGKKTLEEGSIGQEHRMQDESL